MEVVVKVSDHIKGSYKVAPNSDSFENIMEMLGASGVLRTLTTKFSDSLTLGLDLTATHFVQTYSHWVYKEELKMTITGEGKTMEFEDKLMGKGQLSVYLKEDEQVLYVIVENGTHRRVACWKMLDVQTIENHVTCTTLDGSKKEICVRRYVKKD